MTKKQKAEAALFTKLQSDHGYSMLEMRSKRDRLVVTFNTATKSMESCRAITLVVPPDSAMPSAANGKSR